MAEEKKRILWIYEKPLRKEDGGTERLSATIMEGLRSRGYECMGFLVLKRLNDEITYLNERVDDLYSFLKVHRIDIVINQMGYAEWLLKKFYAAGGERWRLEGGRVITCLHFDPHFPTIHRYALSRHDGMRQTIRKLFRLALLPYLRYRERKNYADLFRYLYQASDRFGLLSATHYPFFKKLTRLESYDRLFSIFNPLTFDEISDPSIIRQKDKIVLVVARLSEYHKRISLILETWKRIHRESVLNGWTLAIVGDGPDAADYKRYVAENRLDDVTFYGQCDPEPFYTKAALFLLTSPAEGWGLTLTESLQRGVVPIVMESSPVFREILSDKETGYLVKNGDTKEFGRKIVTLAGNCRLRERMAEACLHRATRFTLDRALDEWEAELNRETDGRKQ
ncbi:glycosyltransferase [Alistipes sp.]|uniref:glycosyltransferase n=1 Tax=Alistipes sp. TaxID=1872444 RepID=UPI003AF15C07